MSKREQKTTTALHRVTTEFGKPTGSAPNPITPPGDGWTLRGGSSQPRENGMVQHFWYWEREVTECEQGTEDGLEHLTQA